jgi:hypothetical protein
MELDFVPHVGVAFVYIRKIFGQRMTNKPAIVNPKFGASCVVCVMAVNHKLAIQNPK